MLLRVRAAPHRPRLPRRRARAGANGKASDGAASIADAPLHWGAGAKHGGGKHGAESVPPEAVLREIDAQELNRMFVRRRGAGLP